MTDSEKRLLSIDLCGRLPYGVKIQATVFDDVLDKYGEETNVVEEKNVVCNLYMMRYDSVFYEGDWIPLECCKPYLRPLSSMSQKELEEYRKMSYYGAFGIRNEDFTETVAVPSFEKMGYLNSHHFDYRGLIEKGLALEAPEGIYDFV